MASSLSIFKTKDGRNTIKFVSIVLTMAPQNLSSLWTIPISLKTGDFMFIVMSVIVTNLDTNHLHIIAQAGSQKATSD